MFVTSRGVTNEVYYMAQKAARFLDTNNVDHAARVCHSPRTAAMKYALGVAATTCSYKDWYGMDLVIFSGSNPANDQPVATKYLHEAKALGTKIVMVGSGSGAKVSPPSTPKRIIASPISVAAPVAGFTQ